METSPDGKNMNKNEKRKHGLLRKCLRFFCICVIVKLFVDGNCDLQAATSAYTVIALWGRVTVTDTTKDWDG